MRHLREIPHRQVATSDAIGAQPRIGQTEICIEEKRNMTDEQMRALMAWVDMRIDEKVEDAFVREERRVRRKIEADMNFEEGSLT